LKKKIGKIKNPFGEVGVSKKIVNIIEDYLWKFH
jgi:UDP-N-acetylglucosamine 2-epimerase